LFVEVNDAARRRYGYTRDELVRMTPDDLAVADAEERVPSCPRTVLEEGQALIQAVHRTRDGKFMDVEINAKRFYWDGKPTILCIVRDMMDIPSRALHTRTQLSADCKPRCRGCPTDASTLPLPARRTLWIVRVPLMGRFRRRPFSRCGTSTACGRAETVLWKPGRPLRPHGLPLTALLCLKISPPKYRT
jgi:PAS domain S-box-containing protein